MGAGRMSAAAYHRFDSHLRALVAQAFELRDGPYLYDAVEAIVEHWHRMPLTLLEERQEQEGRVQRILRLLSETNPDFKGVEPQFLNGSTTKAAA